MDLTLSSGAKLVVTPSSFSVANELKKSMMKACRGINLGLDMVEAELAIATSDEAEAWFFKCCEKATYEGQLITKELFDDPKIGPKAREDYHKIFAEVVKANVAPFFKNPFSVFKELGEKKAEDPLSK